MKDLFNYLKDEKKALEYFKKENEVAENYFSQRQDLVENLYQDVQSRITDYESIRTKKGSYEYYYRTFKEKQYAIVYRQREGEKEQVLLDQNYLAQGSSSLVVAFVKVSDDHKFLAYGFNRDGTDTFNLIIKEIDSDKIVLEKKEVGSSFQWFSDQEFLFTTQDSTLRPDKVFKSDLSGKEEILFSEDNKQAFVYLTRSKDKRKIFVNSATKETNEIRVYDGKMSLFLQRQEKHEYYMDSWFEDYFVLSNKENEEFNLFLVQKGVWKKVVSPSKGKLTDFEVFKNFIVISEFYEYEKVRVISLGDWKEKIVQFEERPYCLEDADHHDFESKEIVVSYSTLIHPTKYYLYDMVNGTKKLLKEDKRQGYNPDEYVQKRIYVNEVPVSICYKKEYPKSENYFLTAYGSYGSIYHTNFVSSRMSLLKNGFKFVIAHVRGGGELGEKWYKDGKFLNKKNTFKDFIAVSEYLKKQGAQNLIISGRSAGGLLIGVVLNERSDLFKAAIAGVPFVDMVNTMLDPNIPLTTSEYEEWGDPNKKEYLDYMKSYSPYDNVTKQDYPPIYIFTAMNDTRVKYWEPAKWHAKLKQFSTGKSLFILECNFEAGHYGNTSKDESIKETCKEYAFAISQVRKS